MPKVGASISVQKQSAQNCITAVLLFLPLLALIGWHFDVSLLKRGFTGLTAMNPLSALLFMLFALNQWLKRSQGKPPWLAHLPMAFVALMGIGRLGSYVLGARFFLDELLFSDKLRLEPVHNQMAWSSAAVFVLLAVAHVSMRTERNGYLPQALAAVSGFVGILVIDSYAFGALSNHSATIPMAINAAILFVLASANIFLSTSQSGFMKPICSGTLAGRTTRRLLWVALLLPPALSMLVAELQNRKVVGRESGEAMVVALISALFVALIWLNAVSSHKSEARLKDAEDATQRSQGFLRSVIDADPSLISIQNHAGTFLLANKACAVAHGLTPQELVGKTAAEVGAVCDVVPGDEISMPQIKQEKITDSDGTDRWLQTIKLPICSPVGEDQCVLTISTDITETVLAEERALQWASEIEDLYDKASCGYHSVDANGVYTRMNETELGWLGYTKEEVVGKMSIRDLLSSDNWESTLSNFEEFKKSGQLRDVSVEYVRKDGSIMPVSVNSTAIYDSEGNYVASRSTVFDLSDRKAAEQLVLATKEEAERANLAKSEFLSRMSHELRTPLNAILGFTQILDLEGVDSRQKECTEQIARGGRHLLQMINEVLDLAKIESGHLSISMEPVNITELVREAASLMEPMAAERGIRIHAKSSAEQLHVSADKQRLLQVVLNLLSNAIKYNKDKGSVNLSLMRARPGRISLEITDTGSGIDAEMIEHLFEPFARLGAERSGIEGTGLGLALSKNLCETMGGSLTYGRRDGGGSVFRIEMHEAESQASQLDRQIGLPSMQPVGRYLTGTVLLIEDNSSNVNLVERVLETRPGVKLLVAMEGALGVELAHRHKPDMVFLDVNLPDMSGFDVLKQLRFRPNTKDLPVIVTSADATEKQIKKMLKAGAQGYLTKPLNIAEMLKTMDGILREVRKSA